MEMFGRLYFALGSLLLVLTAVTCSDTWTAKQKAHKPKTLRSDRMRKVAQWSDDKSQRDYFKDILLKPMLIERQPGTPGNRFVQEHIKTHMSSYGWTIEEDTFEDETPHGLKEFNSIIATQNPKASRKLVLACHHDSKVFTEFKFVAATDSAVPCAMMLDLARLMKDALSKPENKKSHDISLQFMFLDGEEAFERWTAKDSLYGARHLANKMADTMIEVDREELVPEINTIDLFILLDLIGTSSTAFHHWFRDTEKSYQRFQKIETKLVKEDLIQYPGSVRQYFTGGPPRGGGIEDDHKPFLQRGVPILHLISYPFPKEWHKESDNEAALDYQTIDNISKILRIFVAEYLHLSP